MSVVEIARKKCIDVRCLWRTTTRHARELVAADRLQVVPAVQARTHPERWQLKNVILQAIG